MSAGLEVLAYENVLVMKPLVEALAAECREGEWVIFRQPFRWKHYEGDFHNSPVMPNCYEMFSLEEVLREKHLQCRYYFEHAAIVSPSPDPRP